MSVAAPANHHSKAREKALKSWEMFHHRSLDQEASATYSIPSPSVSSTLSPYLALALQTRTFPPYFPEPPLCNCYRSLSSFFLSISAWRASSSPSFSKLSPPSLRSLKSSGRSLATLAPLASIPSNSPRRKARKSPREPCLFSLLMPPLFPLFPLVLWLTLPVPPLYPLLLSLLFLPCKSPAIGLTVTLPLPALNPGGLLFCSE